jgi:hypothetical protein
VGINGWDSTCSRLAGPGRCRNALNALGAGVLFVLLHPGGEVPIDMCDCIMEVLVKGFRLGKVFNDDSTRILQLTLAAESTTFRPTHRF